MCHNPWRNCPVPPPDPENVESEETILKLSLAQLKWIRRAIRSGKLKYSKERTELIEQRINELEGFLTKPE